jgi:hypothetical protein
MDAELKTFLESMETRINNRVDARVSAAEEQIVDRVMFGVDKRIDAAEERIIDRVMERVGGRLDASEERMKDFVRASDHDLETKIVGEFWKWGRTSDLRTKQALGDVGTLNERILAVEDRISALERRSAS